MSDDLVEAPKLLVAVVSANSRYETGRLFKVCWEQSKQPCVLAKRTVATRTDAEDGDHFALIVDEAGDASGVVSARLFVNGEELENRGGKDE